MQETRTELVKRLLDEKAEQNNKIDLNTYVLGLEAMYEAINFIPCCTELKDKETQTFEEWVYMNNYTPKAKQYFDENSIMWTEHELINMYNNEVMNL